MSKTPLLIVEDDLSLAKMLGSVLSLKGYEVIQAHDGEQALAALDAQPGIQCVIQDLGLPPQPDSMEAGLETMQRILQQSPAVKIIVLTGRGKQEAAIQAIREGAFDFFEKPVSMDTLVASIERALLFFDAENSLQEEGLYAIRFNSTLEDVGLKGTKDSFEAQLVRRVLIETDYNVKMASTRLGLRRENLYYLLRKHNIELERTSEMSENA
jgi:DNA-binding NtrC family response regulator